MLPAGPSAPDNPLICQECGSNALSGGGGIDLFSVLAYTDLMRIVSVMRTVGVLAFFVGLSACTSPKDPTNTDSNENKIVCGTEVCPAHASCDGTSCVCDSGFEKVGTLCIDINECLVNHGGCDVFASCVNTPGSFECKCRTGYEGDGTYCYEVGTDGGEGPCGRCDPNAQCVENDDGSFGCLCNEGFEGNGRRCTDIDECANGDCDINATCTNLPGVRSCTCNAGFYGDGLACNAGTDGTVGADCSVPGGQSTCGAGLTCKRNGSVNTCVKTPCSTNADCGKNGSLQNLCLSPGGTAPKECMRVCDELNPASCGRSGVVCSAQKIGSKSYQLCTPDCRLNPSANACPYGSSCGATTGVCEKKSCSSASCATGQVCVTEGSEKICVNDCRVANNCPDDRECNVETGGCEVPKKGYYETCGTNFGECRAGLTCVVFSSGASDGLCLQNCTLDRDCNLSPLGMTSTCSLTLTSSKSVCAIDCSFTFSCPRGTTCTAFGWEDLCFP